MGVGKPPKPRGAWQRIQLALVALVALSAMVVALGAPAPFQDPEFKESTCAEKAMEIPVCSVEIPR